MKLDLCCTCGARWKGEIRSDTKAILLCHVWGEEHTGPGHAPCDAPTAARARAKAEKESEEKRHDPA